MLLLRLPREVREVIEHACRRAGTRESGGMMFGEHVGQDDFRVVETTVAQTGTFAAFLRNLADSLPRLDAFFRRTRHDYRRFNYLGEWHSHPSFALVPSSTDDATMFAIVDDPSTGARFAMSMIVRLGGDGLEVAAFAYFPGGERVDVVVERE